MSTYFVPQVYASFDALREAHYFNAISSTNLEGKGDIFGWWEGIPYKCYYFYDYTINEDCVIAGDRFEEEEEFDEEDFYRTRQY